MPRPRRTRPLNATDSHRAWLELVDTDGPFLAIPPLKSTWRQGMPNFAAEHPERYETLREAWKDFEAAWEALDRQRDSESLLVAYRVVRDEWVTTLLRDVIGWADSFTRHLPSVTPVTSPDQTITIAPQAGLVGPQSVGALVLVVDPQDSLRDKPADRWAATDVDRIDELLRRNGVEIGIVTDGRWWGLVYAAEGKMTASGIVDALDWISQPRTRDAFLTLVSRQYIIGGDPEERLPKLFERSIAEAEEITEALGAQVRSAVELLIQAFSEASAEARRKGLPEPLPRRTHETYEAAVTVMMRVVFLLFAEERGLLPIGELFEQGYGISRELMRLSDRESQESEEALDATSLTWHRLLATSQALYGGASFESLRMPAYGGSLFDPSRFPFLTATTESGTLAVTVSDRVMLHVLRSVQVALVRGEARQISFRDIDVEQIGYIYEGLLGYTCVRVPQVYLGLKGTAGAEPEIPLDKLEELAQANNDPRELANAILEWVKEDQPSAKPSSASAIARSLGAEPEPTQISALTQAVGGDVVLRDRITGWLGLIRSDLRNRPFVVLDGGLLVKETPSRKNAGAHYTPKSLAEEVVTYALQPICYSPGPYQTADETLWKLKPSDELLGLKVADIACGSGAFLVAAARYLADRVVEAWIEEDPENASQKDLRTRAIRKVVANCLYGADINDMAVEMCKLSLWLVSLDPKLPFSFVDDKVFLGNSLLGLTDLDQLRRLHIDPSKAPPETLLSYGIDIDPIIKRASDLRKALSSEIDENDPARSSRAKRHLLERFQAVTADLRKIADGVIAAGLPLGGKPGRALNEACENLRIAVKAAYPPPSLLEESDVPDTTMLDSIIDRGLTPTVTTDYDRWTPLHWVLEAPDVMVDRGGFDAVVGNPPFLGGQKLTGAMGTSMRDWFVNVLAGGRRGSADLVAYFFLRATSLLQANGTLGLVATNTVAQGDTREVGLDAMVADGFTITRAIKSKKWPSASANLEYAAVWGTRGHVAEDTPKVSDDIPVRRITALLEPAGRVEGNPVRLAENAGIAFQGCIVLGKGFVIDPIEAQEWIAADARNDEVLFPYLNGDDLNSRPDCSPSRWVIDFYDRSEEEAATYPLPYMRLYEQVKPTRATQPKGVREAPWWLFLRTRPAMRRAVADLSEVLVIALVSKTVMPMRVLTKQVFSNTLGVFASASYSDQAVLSSSLHQLWAITYGSGMRNDPRYTPSDVFETFPRPAPSERLESIGRILNNERREIMLKRNLGLTKLYNLVNDADIADGDDTDVARMRAIHMELDITMMAVYGWDDIKLDYGHHEFRQMIRWIVGPSARTEILDRLLEENHKRAGYEIGSHTN